MVVVASVSVSVTVASKLLSVSVLKRESVAAGPVTVTVVVIVPSCPTVTGVPGTVTVVGRTPKHEQALEYWDGSAQPGAYVGMVGAQVSVGPPP
jgi:hypothetical protein